nr:hypothetical protein [Tanacetum cinerariifolium]GEZ37627.1 hypothetical protein [Tanacetum cinerariifolium]
MDLHAVSRACHHLDGLVCFSKGSDDMSGYIVGISKPSNKESGTDITKGLVFNAELMDRVFKVPITTVKCIPHGCRLAFSQALKTVLCKVVVQPDSIDAWVRLLLFPRCTLQVYRPKNRLEGKFGNRKSLQQSFILKSLVMWEKDDDITTLVRSILDGSTLGSFGQGGGEFFEDGATGNTNIKQCLRKVVDGYFTVAIKGLSSSGVALYCDDIIKALEGKHPYKPPPSMPSITSSESPLVEENDSVFSCIKSFPKAGRCPPILAEFVASAPPTHLFKPDNGIQPISIGTKWRRLVSKVAMKGVGKEMSKYLSDFQFRVGVSGGAEAILHSVNRVLSAYHNEGSLAMLTADFSNEFNLVDRSALLHEHPLLHTIKDSFKLLLHAWYLDDGTVIGDSEEVVRVLDIIKLFGGAVSRDADFISGLAMRRAANDVDLMGLLLQLHDPHSELLLLRLCMGIAKLFIGLRTCQPVHMEKVALVFDKGLHGSIENIVICGGPLFGDYSGDFLLYPIRFGGLGLYSAKLVSSYAFVASRAQSWVLQDHILRDSGICGMDDDYVSALACLRDTIPSFDVSGFTNKDTVSSKAQQTLANVLFSEMVKDMEAFLDPFGEHAVHCKELSRFKYRQDMIRDVLFDICGHGGISAKKEAHVNFLTDPSDGRSTLRPADVLVFGWVGGKHACVDLVGVSSLVGLSSRGFTAGQAALKAASGKMTKHEKACIENKHVFIPFAFDTFGFLAPEAVELLSRVQRVMHINVMTHTSTDVIFKRIGFAIQKGLAAQLVASLHSTTM